jgi:peroxiredoxin
MMLGSLAVIALAVASAFGAVETGRSAPDFSLLDIDGQKHSLAEYLGKTVVLEWNNPDCPIVRKHYESDNLPKLQRDATADGVVWLLINSGAPGREGADYKAGELKQWLAKHHAAPTVYLRDPDGVVGHAYGAKTTPHMYIIDARGTLVYQGGIDSIPSARQSDIPKATNYVREALAALKAGKPIASPDTKPYGCSVKY